LKGIHLDQAFDVLVASSGANVGKHPQGLLSDFPICVQRNINELEHQGGFAHQKSDLIMGTCSNVGCQPACFLTNCSL
jgi:hypothetical protein